MLGRYDCVLWAIGRHPVTSGIGLEEAGAKMTRGFVHVDKYENVLDAEDKVIPGLHALGDCTVTGWELTPVAIAAGRRLGDRLFANEPRARFIYEDVPTVIFSHPPIGTIGYTEAKAIKQFGADSIQVCSLLGLAVELVGSGEEGHFRVNAVCIQR